uniref:Uncharacterized protein n=1 Tax=Romanomermis culicivorax TaxID=13658 RepID=A0A915IB39_ROMCU
MTIILVTGAKHRKIFEILTHETNVFFFRGSLRATHNPSPCRLAKRVKIFVAIFANIDLHLTNGKNITSMMG